jgi:rubredoxin
MRRECPMCGESMRLQPLEQVSRIPGTLQQSVRHILEWMCPECDYYEEAEGEIPDLSPELEAWRTETR